MKKRILFVEDNAGIRDLFLMMMDEERDLWDVATAEDARQALKIMESSVFDVVVSDMNMPGMIGADFIREVKTRYPRCSRIILSTLGDQERVARCLDATHQFLAKPFDVKAFKAALGRICGLDAYLTDPKLQSVVSQIGKLPSFPVLYMEIMKELDSPNSLIENIAALVAKDPAMTTKMLQIVNSASIGLERKIGNPFEAVEYLGLGTVRSLVLSVHIFSCFNRTALNGFSITQLWDHAIGSGSIARMIMRLEGADAADAEDSYTAGMLHDLGKLMLADSLPEQFQKALNLAAERNIHLPEAEMEVFGATHAGIAAYLLGLWGLPASIAEAVAFHHSPSRSQQRDFSPLAAVHVANVLYHEWAKDKVPGRRAELDMDYLTDVGVARRVDAWSAGVAKLMK